MSSEVAAGAATPVPRIASANCPTEAMYCNDTRGLQGLDRPDASLKNQPPWTALEARSRDLLIAIAVLEQTATPATPSSLQPVLTCWYPGLEATQLHGDLRELTHNRFLIEQPATSTYQLTATAVHLLESYINYLKRLRRQLTDTITLELEHPITPGDLEQLYCKLQTAVEANE